MRTVLGTSGESRKAGSRRGARSAFTLIELLVAITIFVLLLAITVAALNFNTDQRKVRNAAQMVQGFLDGARDRAIYAKQPRGVRFLTDANNPATITGMVYIGPPTLEAQGTLTIAAGGVTLVGRGTRWQALQSRGLLGPGTRIRIPGTKGAWYTVVGVGPGERLTIARPHFDHPAGTNVPQTYELELAPAVLPNQEPVQLPAGVVVDIFPAEIDCNGNGMLDPAEDLNGNGRADGPHSRVPPRWSRVDPMSCQLQVGTQLDVLFSPRGTIVGEAGAGGLLHLLVADVRDVAAGRGPGDPGKEGSELVVTVFTRTGRVAVFAVDPTDGDGNGVADDPFFFAETGAPTR